MPRRRGSKWTASGYSKELGRKIHLGTFDLKRDAAQAEAEHKLKARPTGRETVASFAGRWVDDYPRPRYSSNHSNRERIGGTAGLGLLRAAACGGDVPA